MSHRSGNDDGRIVFGPTSTSTVASMSPQTGEALVKIKEAERDAAVATANANTATANASAEIAKSKVQEVTATVAVPAQELTNRAKQVSYRQYVASASAIILALLAWAAGLKDGDLVTVWLALAALAGAERAITTGLTRRASPRMKKETDAEP